MRPSSTTPSTGIFSPGRTRRRSPDLDLGERHFLSLPSASTRRAVFGASASSCADRLAGLRRCARSSSTWPSSTSVTITAAASKYTPTLAAMHAESCGKRPGANTATTL